MFFVDQLDQSISAYTIAAPYGNKRWIRRFITNLFNFLVHNTFVLYKQFVLEHRADHAIFSKLIQGKCLHNYFMHQLGNGLLKTKINPPSLTTMTHIPISHLGKRSNCVHSSHQNYKPLKLETSVHYV